MKTTLLKWFGLFAGAWLLAGCSTNQSTTYVEPNSPHLIANVGEIDIQDFANAADTMVASLTDNLINQGKLQSAVPDQPSLLAISRITNNTGRQIDTDELVKKIRVALNRTGKILTIACPEDPIACDQANVQNFFQDTKHPRLPDYSLSGKIIEDRARAGNVRQSAFIFQLSLSDTHGVAVWEEEKTIVKQGTQPAVGF